ncbi:MAG: gamma-glutamyl-gamma-aminobutyrate hydrolase family protein [Bryobacteraceae bacterium]|jgi:putative glutamine amidotransferase
MKTVAVTQRVAVDPPHATRRDCLDQVWIKFLLECGLLPIPIPNSVEAALTICEKVSGIVLTGGNDLTAYGGDAPDRDETESALLDLAERRDLPVLGVCRGMQMIQHRFGTRLQQVHGHVAPRQHISIDGKRVEVNSFHNFGAMEVHPPLMTWAIADDGVIEAVKHSSSRMIGVMWHPERRQPFASDDVALFSRFFEA